MTSTETSNKLFDVFEKGNKLRIKFYNETVANEFGRMDFYSKLLHSYKPDNLRIWRVSERLNVGIKGWPKSVKFKRIAEKDYEGLINDPDDFDLGAYSKTLEKALNNTLEGEIADNGVRLNIIEIGLDNDWKQYRFYSKARTLAALCVLYDLEPHPRNDLEINISPDLQPEWRWPLSQEKISTVIRVYGDPSKTADVLRNEGWSREGGVPGMKVFNKNIGGARQQMYQLLRREQSIPQQVMRTNIPTRWKKELYKSQDYTCRICGLKYEEEFLAPDHRIPVIFQADELTEANFKTKLMTLCRFCNQQKREFCKRIKSEYNWETSPWAYPEKFSIEKIKNEILVFAKIQRKSIETILEIIKKELTS